MRKYAVLTLKVKIYIGKVLNHSDCVENFQKDKVIYALTLLVRLISFAKITDKPYIPSV